MSSSESNTTYSQTRSIQLLLLWINCVLCFSCFCVCSLLPCGHLLERADLLGFVGAVYCIFVTFSRGILGQVLNLIVLFPDLCLRSYFHNSLLN